MVKRVVRESPIFKCMSVAFLMPSLSDDGQGCNTDNGKLAIHLGRNMAFCQGLDVLDRNLLPAIICRYGM